MAVDAAAFGAPVPLPTIMLQTVQRQVAVSRLVSRISGRVDPAHRQAPLCGRRRPAKPCPREAMHVWVCATSENP
jgi:hypothetical protein